MYKTEKKLKLSIIAFIISLFYWIPASMILVNIFNSSGSLFPEWLESILFPGYLFGFGLGFGGGAGAAWLGQIITLGLVFLLVRPVVGLIAMLTT